MGSNLFFNLKISQMKKIILMLAVGLGLTSCDKREEQYEQDLINSCTVKIMGDNYVTARAISSCTGLDTSWTVQFGVAMCINIANLPEVDDVRYDDYEFYAMVNGRKTVGMQGIKDQISDRAMAIIDGNITMQLSGHTDLAVYLLAENYYNAEFYVEADGVTRKLSLSEVY